jgi:hypothetical protein
VAPGPRGPGTPTSARVYDLLAGGYHSYQADEALAGKLERLCPEARDMVHANQASWPGRSLGQPRPPASSSTSAPDSPGPDRCGRPFRLPIRPRRSRAWTGTGRCLITRARLASDGVKNVVVITADFTGPTAVLADPRVTEVIDLAEPVCVVLGLVPHYMTADQAREVTAEYARQLTPGSIIVFTAPVRRRAAVRPDPRGVHPRSAAQSHPLRRHLVLRRAASHPPGRATGHGVPAGVGRRPGGPGRAYVIGGIHCKP